jgi:hypothetical protein
MLRQVHLATHSTQQLGRPLAGEAMKIKMRVVGLDVWPVYRCVSLCITFAVSNFEHFVIYVLFCKPRISIITLLFGLLSM